MPPSRDNYLCAGKREPLQEKEARLLGLLREMDGVVVAFSGGVDSAFLLKAACEVLESRVVAATAVSETYPAREREEARLLAASFGAEHRLVETDEWADESFRANTEKRCYYCKRELFLKLGVIAREKGGFSVAAGATMSDQSDFRPGTLAGRELGVVYPLVEAGLYKEEVRLLSRRRGLPTADKPAAACLASRFPYGMPLEKTKIKMVEAGEDYLRTEIGVRGHLRVRYHGEVARIEVDPGDFALVADHRPEIAASLRKIGFRFITLDLDGFRSGGFNPDG